MVIMAPFLLLTTSFQLTLVLAPCNIRRRGTYLGSNEEIRAGYVIRSLGQLCTSIVLMTLFAINNQGFLLDKAAISSMAMLIGFNIGFCIFNEAGKTSSSYDRVAARNRGLRQEVGRNNRREFVLRVPQQRALERREEDEEVQSPSSFEISVQA